MDREGRLLIGFCSFSFGAVLLRTLYKSTSATGSNLAQVSRLVDGVLRPLSVDLLVLSERDVEVGDDHDLWDGISHGERVSRGCRAAHHGHAFLEARASILCFCGAPCDQLGVVFASAAGFLAPGMQQQSQQDPRL